jgi:hypothetical protein
MPLIQPEHKPVTEQFICTLPTESVRELKTYAKFLNNSSVAHVLTHLIATLSKDSDFKRWKAEHPGALADISQPGRATRKSRKDAA